MEATNAFKNDASIGNRYLADQLSDAERESFEAYLRENPEALDELEATARLKVGLRRLRATGELSSLLKSRPAIRQPWFLAMAASLAIVVISVALMQKPAPTAPSTLFASRAALVDAAGRALPLAKTYALLQTRTENYAAVIELPPTPRAVELRIMPDSVALNETYRVALTRLADDGSAAPVASLESLQSSADGFITVFADSSRLSPGRYRISVTPGTAPDAGETFLVKMEPASASSPAPDE